MGQILSNLSKEILYTLADIAKVTGRWVINPYDPQTIGPGIATRKHGYTIYNLEKNNYLERKKVRGKEYFKLRPKAEQIVRKRKFKDKLETLKWNGKWYLLIFDIPEKKRRYRENLIKILKWVGFYQLQKSVWVFPFDILDEFDEIFSGLIEEDWFEYVEVSRISNQDKLFDFFKIIQHKKH